MIHGVRTEDGVSVFQELLENIANVADASLAKSVNTKILIPLAGIIMAEC